MPGAPKHVHAQQNGKANGRYPPARTSPWFFLVLVTVTVAFILAGIFAYEPLLKLIHWLAVVL